MFGYLYLSAWLTPLGLCRKNVEVGKEKKRKKIEIRKPSLKHGFPTKNYRLYFSQIYLLKSNYILLEKFN